MNRSTYRGTVIALTGVALLASLAACQRPSADKTAGQKLDAAVAGVEQRAGEVKAEVKQAANAASDKVKGTANDIAITAEINARLARDAQLSAFAINVDTSAGRVVLKGSAPDLASRERARSLAAAVEGVNGVENLLVINAKS